MDKITIPYLTAEQMKEVDRLMTDVCGIHLIQMLETAGRQLARLSVKRFLDGKPVGKKVVVLAGSGGNGGGVLVCARILSNWGAEIDVVLSRPRESLSGLVRHQVEILERLPVEFNGLASLESEEQPDLILDGIIGYSLRGAPRGTAAEMIRWANAQECPILSLDIPSGLDPNSGVAYTPVIKASATMTLALPKEGLKVERAGIVGELYLADIGVPPALYHSPSLGLDVGPIFDRDEIILLSNPK